MGRDESEARSEPATADPGPPAREPGEGARSGVQSIDRAVRILRCFSPRSPVMGASDLARATGLTTSTTHRLLLAMQHNGLVRQTRQRRYALGPLLVQLARSGAFPTSLRDAASDVMHELRDLVGETVGLHELLPSNERAVIDQVESHHPLRRTYTELGVPIPLPYGAPGKAILAFVPHEVCADWLARPLTAVTERTVTDPDLLRAELARARADGYAMSFAERTPGIHTVAAPVFDHTDHVIGCLSVSAPEIRMPRERMTEIAPTVKRSAWRISEVLGATPHTLETCITAATPPDE